jgi:hypothetical protein
MPLQRPARYVAAGAAAVALAFGAYAVGNSNTSSGTSSASAPAQGAAGGGAGQTPPAGAMRGGFGTPATGADAAKAKAAALARYSGSVEQVMKLPDGSFEVHVITSKGEYHVHVSKAFEVTGADQGGPGGPGGATPPSGTAPPSGSGSSSSSGKTS